MKELKLALPFAVLCLAAGPGLQRTEGASNRPLLSVLQSELARNLQVLGNETVPVYFASYTLHDQQVSRLSASFGTLQHSDESHNRMATVEIRVGSYDLDNTHPIRGDQGTLPRIARTALPITDEVQPVRLALWRATDRAFKQASEAFTRVKTNIAAKVKEEDPAPDFSHEEPQVYEGAPVSYTLDAVMWEERVRRISAPFAEDPLVFRSDVSLSVEASNRLYTNSEGSQIATGDLSCRLFIQAMTKAEDGMELPLYISHFARSLEGLPSEQQLIAEVRDMMNLLQRLRKAPIVDPFSGPAILSGRAAGVFFHEIFGHRIEASRQRNANDAQTFSKMVASPVLPPFLSVVFDPTLDRVGTTELMGTFLYDDEGVRAQPVTIVNKGVLEGFLMDRSPIKAFSRSNGHGRAEPGFVPVSRQSNMVVQSTRAVPPDALMDMLRDEARKQGRSFGLLFENIEGGFTTTNRGAANAFNVLPNIVYRIFTDGRPPELVRGVDLIGTPLTAFNRIVVTGDKMEVFNGICGAESGGVPVSASAPAMLVSEVEVQKKVQSQETLPILPSPTRGGKS